MLIRHFANHRKMHDPLHIYLFYSTHYYTKLLNIELSTQTFLIINAVKPVHSMHMSLNNHPLEECGQILTRIFVSQCSLHIVLTYVQCYKTWTTQFSRLAVTLEMHCSDDYYGSDCSLYCEASPHGNYVCDDETGSKVCSKGEQIVIDGVNHRVFFFESSKTYARN